MNYLFSFISVLFAFVFGFGPIIHIYHSGMEFDFENIFLTIIFTSFALSFSAFAIVFAKNK